MPLDTGRIGALLFDVDGTLRDTDDEYIQRLNKTLRKLKFLFNDNNLERTSRRIVMGLESPAHTFYSLLDWLTLDDEVVTLGIRLQEFRLLKPKHEFLTIPGVAESLEKLKERYPMAVVSARGEGGTLAFLEEAKLSGYFQAVASGQTVSRTKPWPDPIYWAAEQLKVDPENCLMVGDTTVDMRAGRKAGAQTAGVLSGFGLEKELRGAKADAIMESVAQLPEALL